MCKALLIGAVLGSSFLAQPQSAYSEPATIFRPVLNDIRNQLPKGLVMRLPAAIPATPVKLYPDVESDNTSVRVNLTTAPDCRSSANPAACTVGGMGVFKSTNVWPPQGQNFTRVNLGRGINGYYVIRSNGDRVSKYVFWEQGGLKYVLGVGIKQVSQKQLLEIATSMVSEPPITSAK